MRHTTTRSVPALVGLAATAAILVAAEPALGGTIAVRPSGDTLGQTDGDAIRAAIARAKPGDTVFLRAGTYYLGKEGQPDTVTINGSRGAGTNGFVAEWAGRSTPPEGNLLYQSSLAAIDHLTDWVLYGPEGAEAFGRDLSVGSFDECIGTNKDNLTIRGEPGTKITSPRGAARWRNDFRVLRFDEATGLFVLDANGRPIVDPTGVETVVVNAGGGFLGSLVINSRNVTLRDMQLDGMVWPIVAMRSGFTIDRVTITNSGHGIVAMLDAKQTMPSGSWLGLVRSTIRRCTIDADNPLRIHGSGVTVEDCTLTQSVGTFGSVTLGPPGDLHLGSVLDLTRADFNAVDSCAIVCDGNQGGLYLNPSETPGTANFNAITHNTFIRANFGGVIVRQFPDDHEGVLGVRQTTGNLVLGNRFEGCVRSLRIEAFADSAGRRGEIGGNSMVHNTVVDAIGASLRIQVPGGGRVIDNVFAFNDFRESGHPGLPGAADIELASLVADGIEDNWIIGNMFPAGTGICEQVRTFGAADASRNHILGPGACP